MFSVDPAAHRALAGTVLALSTVDRRLQVEVDRVTRSVMSPVWTELVAARMTGDRLTRGLLAGVYVMGGNPGAAAAAQSSIPVGRELVPRSAYHLAEFGTSRAQEFSTYTRRSPRGVVHTVTRRTRTGLPARNATGRVVYPSFAQFGPRLVSLWVQLVVKVYADALESEGG